jgi:delta 1-pyrroline-5-carboxylate dehydrogenase
MIRALKHYADRFVGGTGDWSILALDGILMIPLVFAAFFFPLAILIGVIAVALVTGGTLAVIRAVQVHHHRHGHT